MSYKFTNVIRGGRFLIDAEPTPEHLVNLNASINEFSRKIIEKEEMYILDGLSVDVLENLITLCNTAIQRKKNMRNEGV